MSRIVIFFPILTMLFRFVRSHRFGGSQRCVRRSFQLSMQARGPPTEPINFGNKFTLPNTNEKLILAQINAHEKDASITFEAEYHEYFVDGIAMELSVTGMVSMFFEKFNADEVIRKMMNGPRWPREGYINKDGAPYNEAEIKSKWDSIGLYSRNLGTWMHYNIERYLNNLETSPQLEEMEKFVNFYTDIIKGRDIQPYRTEWRIAAPDVKLAGSVDFVGRFPDGTYALLDWKRSKDLEGGLTNKFGRRGQYPLEHLDDCDGSKYFLQLNIYRYILETYYDMKISYMGVVSFHPNIESYFLADAPSMEKEVNDVLQEVSRRRAEGEIFGVPQSVSSSSSTAVTAAQKASNRQQQSEDNWMDQTMDSQQQQRPQSSQPLAPPPRIASKSGTGALRPPSSQPMSDIPF